MTILAEEVANEIAKRWRAAVPGLKVAVREGACGVELLGLYNCPCGEISGIVKVISEKTVHRLREQELPMYCADITQDMVEDLRQHVRSEGNEPDF